MKKIIVTIIFILLVLAAMTPAFAQDEWFEVAEASAVTYGVPIGREIPIQEKEHKIHKRPIVHHVQANAQLTLERVESVREPIGFLKPSDLASSDTNSIMVAVPIIAGCQAKLVDD
jgi:hypothetical protein